MKNHVFLKTTILNFYKTLSCLQISFYLLKLLVFILYSNKPMELKWEYSKYNLIIFPVWFLIYYYQFRIKNIINIISLIMIFILIFILILMALYFINYFINHIC